MNLECVYFRWVFGNSWNLNSKVVGFSACIEMIRNKCSLDFFTKHFFNWNICKEKIYLIFHSFTLLAGTFQSVFDFCAGRCRHNSESVVSVITSI